MEIPSCRGIGEKEMAQNISKSNRLDLFSKIKSAILNSAILQRKFKDENFYEFEPPFHSLTFKHLPYIVINIPSTDTKDDVQVFDHNIVGKDYEFTIMLVMDYEARDNFKAYAQEIMKNIEAKESDFELDGFYDLEIDLIRSPVELLDKRKVISGEFKLTFNGSVNR